MSPAHPSPRSPLLPASQGAPEASADLLWCVEQPHVECLGQPANPTTGNKAAPSPPCPPYCLLLFAAASVFRGGQPAHNAHGSCQYTCTGRLGCVQGRLGCVQGRATSP
eukprot:351312-Chlamydomonas_euryale.AAC.3